MRKMRTLTLINFLCLVSVPIVCAAESNISLVTADLSVLARVTNAIYLVSKNVFDDPVKVKQFISEALLMNPNVITRMMLSDVRSILPAVQEIQKRSVKERKLIKGKPKFFSTFNKYLMDGWEPVKNLMTRSDGFDIDILRAAAANRSGGHYACDESVLEAVNSGYDEEYVDWKKKDDIIRAELLNRLEEAIPKLLDCLHQLPAYVKNLPDSSLNVSISKLFELTIMKDVVSAIVSKSNQEMDKYSKEAGMLREDAKRIDAFLKGAKNRTMAQTILELRRSVKMWMLRRTSPLELWELTNGFVMEEEFNRTLAMIEVVNDVNSKWFRQKVAKGKSTAELARALEPFQRFGEKLRELANVTDRLSGRLDLIRNLGPFIDDFARETELLENLEDGTINSEFLEKARSTLKECRPKLIPLKKANFNRFVELLLVANRIATSMHELAKAVGTFLRSMRAEKFDEALRGMEKVMNASRSTNVLYKWPGPDHGPHWRHATYLFRKLKPVYMKHIELRSAIQQFENQNFAAADLGWKENVAKSGLNSYFDCLETNKYDPHKVYHSARVVSKVHSMLKRNYSELIEFLEEAVLFQEKEREVEQMARELSKQIKMLSGKGNFSKLEVSETQSIHVGNALKVLVLMNATDAHGREAFVKSTNLTEAAHEVVVSYSDRTVQSIWGDGEDARKQIDKVLTGLDDLNEYCGTVVGKDPLGMKLLFMRAAKVPGIPVKQKVLENVSKSLSEAGEQEASDVFWELSEHRNNFESYKSDLTGAGPAMTALQTMFDEFFGNSQKTASQVVKVQQVHLGPSILAIVGICLGVFVLILVLSCVGYGFTRNGRNRYTNLYLYYFGKPEEFEKRWRYSMFRDRTDGENALIDATREINLENVLKALRKGVYINVYNKFGNTPLHTVARLGHADLVAALIRNGADRTLLNARNRTAEQMIPAEKEEKFAECERIFAKYRNKKFRVRVPEVFPVSSFHIYIEERTDDALTTEFMEKFRAITSEEPLATTTHCVVKVDGVGIMTAENLNIIYWIFNGAIIVKDSWMADCVRDEKLIEQDQRYLVESVKYKGVLFENVVLPWTEAKAKSTMPFLYGVFAVFVMEVCPNIETLSSIITGNGGKVLDAFPDKSQFNQGSHPYLHAHLGPLFVIHDGKTPGLMDLKKDPMFTVLTEDELITFLLKRQINRDTRKNPIPVVGDD